ncbi:hypothetical protein EDD37DRAFT_633801 [Exophiala viscosa]|uniref:Uncharacterized protein n=1 Tax=Exophiala viscosa TaxID=2486360 RepID=A0AAN6ICJ3_9EURO|nr:hypothetical protein EDD36DRAFT_440108 [Exophiala viscosa]KAI1623091.1 hypothetical protein EDD37DRAFT_633801 [Exophiala viscosa]
MHLDQNKSLFHETYFCWIGGFDDSAAFDYRIQNPVVAVELDHHSRVFLTNKEPPTVPHSYRAQNAKCRRSWPCT